jgi:signal transduction histidine kinase
MNNSLLDLKSLNNFTPEIKDIKSILDEGVKLSYVYINDKDIDLTFEAKESASVLIDENKFLACIVNIIKNAIESIEKKGTIKVLLDTNEDTAIIKISNNGAPIPIDKQQEIFKAGYTTKVTGSGLGLHICYNNLKAQNAELILSKSNKDLTEFEITLPIYKN